MKRAVSTMISPMTAPRVLGESSTLGRGATPHEGMRELRLEVRLGGRGGFVPMDGCICAWRRLDLCPLKFLFFMFGSCSDFL